MQLYMRIHNKQNRHAGISIMERRTVWKIKGEEKKKKRKIQKAISTYTSRAWQANVNVLFDADVKIWYEFNGFKIKSETT